MNKWTKNRIKELTEERRDELAEYFEEHEWADDIRDRAMREYEEMTEGSDAD